MDTLMTTRDSQNYYAECREPDEDRGLRIGITLECTEPDQPLPERIPAFTCPAGIACPAGGAHDLLPISADHAAALLAENDDPGDEGRVI